MEKQEKKIKYEEPELIDLAKQANLRRAQGANCTTGSGATDDCNTGNSATLVCISTGTSADDCAPVGSVVF
jgi:hypothetical protein